MYRSESTSSATTAGLNSPGSSFRNRGLGVVTFKPRNSSKAYVGAINTDRSLARVDTQERYNGILHFVEAIERETTIHMNDLELNDMLHSSNGSGRNLFRSSPMILADGVKLDHSNVWL